MRNVVILAGGSGTRLWPLSRVDKPKQVLPLAGGLSLLRVAYNRLEGLVDPSRIYVCTAAAHAEQVRAQIPELPEGNLIGEPTGRDTANAVGLASAVVGRDDPDATLAIVTSDHLITPEEEFRAAISAAFDLVETRPRSLATFGIEPTHPHTGLGYVERGEPIEASPAFVVDRFREKPDRATAEEYLATGRFWWNSGMFVWRAETLLSVLDELLPASAAELRRVAGVWDSAERDAVLAEVYPQLQKISVDFAVMEPVSQGKVDADVVVVPMNVKWLDVGSWAALAGTYQVDARGNRRDENTLVCLLDSDDNVIVTDDPDHLIATVGLREHIIVHTRDVTMVCPLVDGERVKDLVAHVQTTHPTKYT
ncbi:mannose-1-phosphate guanylyltransferase [Kribbella deserti]|uniref:Mannose-1-phosphate guanylyltransferase n=1 Tax=Kribbella deserti TaxID=1926257 RepID=A0ABV6QPW1_9ACTN